MKYILTLVTLVLMLSLGAVVVQADGSCQPIYGGGETCTAGNIVINKTVLVPQSTNQFVDNLGVNDARYNPGDNVKFQIAVTNNGQSVISKTTVEDVFPQFLNFSSGPGNFDTNTKTLTFEVDNLNPNETRDFYVVGQVVAANQLPANSGVTCIINQATATTSDSQTQQDNAQFCIQTVQTTKGGLPVLPQTPVTTTPPTGPEMLPLLGMIPTGIAGFLLRKKSKKNRGE